jgi:hypothetical protein
MDHRQENAASLDRSWRPAFVFRDKHRSAPREILARLILCCRIRRFSMNTVRLTWPIINLMTPSMNAEEPDMGMGFGSCAFCCTDSRPSTVHAGASLGGFQSDEKSDQTNRACFPRCSRQFLSDHGDRGIVDRLPAEAWLCSGPYPVRAGHRALFCCFLAGTGRFDVVLTAVDGAALASRHVKASWIALEHG